VPTLDAELVAFLNSGLSVMAATRDGRLRPETVRVLALEARAGEEEMTVFLPDAVSARMLENLRDNGRIAVVATHPMDNRSVQLKGAMVSCQPATDLQRSPADAYRAKMARSLAQVGVPQGILFRAQFWPAHAVRFRVEGIFSQTPGPAAGNPFDSLSPEKGDR
jgi:hypothetical protein